MNRREVVATLSMERQELAQAYRNMRRGQPLAVKIALWRRIKAAKQYFRDKFERIYES